MWCTKNSNNQTFLYLKLSPNAKTNKFIGFIEYEKPPLLKVAIAAPPLDGKANKELINFLSKTFKIAKSNITITKGFKSAKKIVQITGLDSTSIINKITEILQQNNESNNQLSFL